MRDVTQSGIVQALKNSVWISLLVLACGIIVLLSEHSLYLKEDGQIIPQMLRELGVILCSIGLISVLYELLIRKQLIADYNQVLAGILNPDASRLGINAIFMDRDDRAERGRALDVLLRGARAELFCLGLGFYQFLPDRREQILVKLRQGCRFRFLIYDVTAPSAQTLDESLGYADGTLLTFLHAQRRMFLDFMQQAAKAGIAADRFEVRTYTTVPMFGALHLDRMLPDSRLLVELHGLRVEGSTCPGLELLTKSKGWYGFYVRQMELIWEGATPLQAEA